MISLESLHEMFDSIDEKTPWDMSGPMLWGYFFTANVPAELERVAPLLEAKGLRLVSIYPADKQSESDSDLWWLHMERVETHSPETLYERNLEYYRFADQQRLLSYDGMDVGPAPITDSRSSSQ